MNHFNTHSLTSFVAFRARSSRVIHLLFLIVIALVFIGCGMPEKEAFIPSAQPVSRPTNPRLPTQGTVRGDVAVLQTVLSDRLPLSGQEIIATTTIKNIGTSTSSAGKVRYYLSLDKAHNKGDRFLNTETLPRLKRNDVFQERVKLRIPADVRPGVYYVLIKLVLPESHLDQETTNNLKALNIEVREKKAEQSPVQPEINAGGYDWGLFDASTSLDQARSGQKLTTRCVVQNLGGRALPTGRLRYYLSRDTQLDDGDHYLNHDAVRALKPGAHTVEEANMSIPSDVPKGSYFLLFVMDPDGEVTERDEANNAIAIPLEIR